jgi:hypothetical protein
MLTCNNETDIFMPKWKKTFLPLEECKLVMHPTKKPLNVKQIDSIEI